MTFSDAQQDGVKEILPYLQSFTRDGLADFLLPFCRIAVRKRRRSITEEVCEELAIKRSKHHAKQIFLSFYQRGLGTWDEMLDLSESMRDWLKSHLDIFALDICTEQRSADGTVKVLWRLDDKKTVESVLIPATGQDARGSEESGGYRGVENEAALDDEDWSRITICISSQVGCAMACKFCLTGVQGFDRHLEVHEIVAQVAQMAKLYPLSNIVFMGMGEPLHNPDVVFKACQIFRDDAGLSFARRRVTVSTSGLVPQIERLASQTDVALAISLSGTTDAQREAIMPVNKKWPLASLMEACRQFQGGSKNWITFEYVMLKEINDTLDDARRLVELLQGIRAKVNLIPFNPFPGAIYARSDPKQVQRFKDYLLSQQVFAFVRVSRGDDILAACGQLRSALGTARGTEKHRATFTRRNSS